MNANSTITRPQSTPDPPASSMDSPAFLWIWRARHDQAMRSLRNLARRHGSTTERQRGRLVDSVVRHVNEGHFDLGDANDFLETLGIEPVRGPGQISFRVPLALAMVHEDVETDIDTLEGLLESSDPAGRMYWTRFDGCPDGYTMTRPSRPDPNTERRYTVVQGDVRLTMTRSRLFAVRPTR